MLGWVVALSPLAFILVMNFAFERFSATGIALMFMLFSAAMGASLSYVFLVFSLSSLTTVFGITAGTFAIMAVVGYTTKTDLTRFGSLLMMALIGIVIAMVVNWFMKSSQLDYIISIIGVLIFTGLIAYDTQKIKNMGAQVGLASDHGRKLAVMGAMSLYLDFINLFLFLLRLLGRRD
jgi:FtsH-binding integral membrane protein